MIDVSKEHSLESVNTFLREKKVDEGHMRHIIVTAIPAARHDIAANDSCNSHLNLIFRLRTADVTVSARQYLAKVSGPEGKGTLER